MLASNGGTRIFFVGGIEGWNAILRGQKSKNLQKIADFGHFFLLTGGASGGAEPPTGGAFAPHYGASNAPQFCEKWSINLSLVLKCANGQNINFWEVLSKSKAV